MKETWVRLLIQEDPLEKETATHSSILAWEIPWTEEPGGLHSIGSQRVTHNWTHTQATLSLSSFGELKPPTRGGMATSGWDKIPRAPPCYLVTNQSEERHTVCSLHPKFCLKTFSKAIGEFRGFELKPQVLLGWPCNKPFSAPNSDIWFIWLHCTSGIWPYLLTISSHSLFQIPSFNWEDCLKT